MGLFFSSSPPLTDLPNISPPPPLASPWFDWDFNFTAVAFTAYNNLVPAFTTAALPISAAVLLVTDVVILTGTLVDTGAAGAGRVTFLGVGASD